MGRHAEPAAEVVDVQFNEGHATQANANIAELAVLNAERADAAYELARTVGYDGDVTVAALEDGIRFYQRRSVESLLECGKRLLVLKELTPHGEFTQRVEALGFAERSARRFMQAASKASKSAKLADLAGQVKSASAFLELITSDDDDLKAIAELDDVDRMSASELRAALRDLRAERDADRDLLARKNETIDELRRKTAHTVAWTDWEDSFKPLLDQADYAIKETMKRLGDLHAVVQTAIQIQLSGMAPEGQLRSLERARGVLALRLDDGYQNIARYLERTRLLYEQTLVGYVNDLDN